jgi:hypothetical protein
MACKYAETKLAVHEGLSRIGGVWHAETRCGVTRAWIEFGKGRGLPLSAALDSWLDYCRYCRGARNSKLFEPVFCHSKRKKREKLKALIVSSSNNTIFAIIVIVIVDLFSLERRGAKNQNART